MALPRIACNKQSRIRRFTSATIYPPVLERTCWALTSLACSSHLNMKVHGPLVHFILSRSVCSADGVKFGQVPPALRIAELDLTKEHIATNTGNENERMGHDRPTNSSAFIDNVITETKRTGNESPTSSSVLASGVPGQEDFSSEEWKDSETFPSGDEDELKNVISCIKTNEHTDQLQFNHPWEEWISLVNMLYKNNYFHGLTKVELEHDIAMRGCSRLVKRAIMEFGKERGDIIRFLTVKHISGMVSIGCPSTDRKVVNASKRLRVLCGLSEEQVCLKCKLKSFCTKAYAAADEQFEVHTVDVARVLYAFAVNASPNAESQLSYPMVVVKSACHLLDEFVKLSEYAKDLALPSEKAHKIIVKQPVVPSKEIDSHSKQTQMHGEWKCPECTFVNFQRNMKCRECSAARPLSDDSDGNDEIPMLDDWRCPKCRFINFRRNDKCKICLIKRPTSFQTLELQELEPGDWKCSRCNFINFRRNAECHKCGNRSASLLTNSGGNRLIVHTRKPLNSTGEQWGSQKVMQVFGADKGWKPSVMGHISDDTDDDELERVADVIVTHNVTGGLEDDENEGENEDDDDALFLNKSRKAMDCQSRDVHERRRMEPEDEESKWARILNQELRVTSNDLADDEDVDDDVNGNDDRSNSNDSFESWRSVLKNGLGKGKGAYINNRRERGRGRERGGSGTLGRNFGRTEVKDCKYGFSVWSDDDERGRGGGRGRGTFAGRFGRKYDDVSALDGNNDEQDFKCRGRGRGRGRRGFRKREIGGIIDDSSDSEGLDGVTRSSGQARSNGRAFGGRRHTRGRARGRERRRG